MLRAFTIPIGTTVAVIVSTVLVLLAPAASPALAASNSNNGTPDLLGVAYNFGRAAEDSIIFITNTSQDTSIRALVTVRDASGNLVGCGLKSLKAGDRGVVYIVTTASGTNGWAETVLSVKVFGLSGSGSLTGKLNSQSGLAGSIAQVDQSTGATRAIVPMQEVGSSNADRQTQLDECFAAGPASPLANSENVVTTEQPSKWQKKS